MIFDRGRPESEYSFLVSFGISTPRTMIPDKKQKTPRAQKVPSKGKALVIFFVNRTVSGPIIAPTTPIAITMATEFALIFSGAVSAAANRYCCAAPPNNPNTKIPILNSKNEFIEIEYAARILPKTPIKDPMAKPHLRPKLRIKKANGNVPAAVPVSIIVIGAVTKVRLSSNIEIETNEAEMKARVRPLLNSAWQRDSITTLFMFCFVFCEEL